MSIVLRDYQRAALDAVHGYFHEKTGNPLVVMPTGSGKSPTLAAFMREALAAWPETRIISLVHVKELIEQSFRALIRQWPEAPAGIYSAGLNQRDLRSRIVFASIQSIYKRAFDLQWADLVIVDEAHMIPAKGDGMYRRFIGDLLRINPAVKLIGFTATPYRMTSGALTTGDDPIFTDIAYEIGIRELIEQGWLCPIISKGMTTQFDLSGVQTRGGEFVADQLAAAVDRDSITQAAVEEIVAYGRNRRSWLVFATGVDHAFHIRDAIRARGISAETITGEAPATERAGLIRAYQAGQLRCLTNADILTTGFDAPATDLLAVLRPTRSPGLWVQICGRGTRLAEGKENCLVLDFGENVSRHGPLDMIRPKEPGQGGGPAPTKECPDCQSIVFAGVRRCPDCGYAFPEPEPEIAPQASAAPLLSTQRATVEWLAVDEVTYQRHQKPGKPDSLRVTYRCGLTWHSEWVCFEHVGYPRDKAVQWWSRRTGGGPTPKTVSAALTATETLPAPSEIAIRVNGKYTEIVGHKFDGMQRLPPSGEGVRVQPASGEIGGEARPSVQHDVSGYSLAEAGHG
jgi:DNA repair protein RadD